MPRRSRQLPSLVDRPTRRAAGRLLLNACATTAAILVARPAAAAIYDFSNPAGGALNVSTNYTPAGIPNSADTLRVSALPTLPGFLTLRVAANQSIGRIELNHFAPTTIDADVDGSNQPFTLTLSTGQLAFGDAITSAPDVPLDTLFLYAPVAGGNGLLKTGPGFAFLGGSNLYTGGTTISGPGGLSVTNDAALGDSNGGVTLGSGGTLRAYSSFATNRALTVNADGGRLESFGTLTLNGAIGGTGTLTIGRFTAGTVVVNSTASTLNGGLVIAQSNTVNLFGRFANVSSVTLGGTLNLGLGTTGPSSNAINDAASIISYGGTLNVAASAASSVETLGTLSLAAGTTTLNLDTTISAGNQLAFSSLSRANRSTAFVRGRNLGAGPLTGQRALVTFADVSNLPLVGGGAASGTTVSIVPFVFGNANANDVTEAGLVTRTANGLRALDATNYAANPLTAAATDNVRVTDTAFTLNSAKTVNALVIRDTINSAGQTGITGTGTLSITSGAIVAVSDLAGEELLIDNPIAFGAAEGVIHTAPAGDGNSQLLINGAISGTNGLTKSGVGDLLLNGASTYSGVTTINAGSIVAGGDVLTGVDGALGNSSADVVINAGVTGTSYVGLQVSSLGATVSRNIIVRQNANANSLAMIGTSVPGNSATFSGQITVEGGFLNLFASVDPDALTLSGAVVGAGGLQDANVNASPSQLIRLTGPNSYAGGTQIRAGTWQVGSATALGSGTVFFVGNGVNDSDQTGAIQAFGGARSLANSVVFRATPVFSGSNALTFAGAIDLGSVAREVNVTNSADTIFSGVVGRGGLIKRGVGRLILSNSNTYNGQTILNDGTLRITNGGALGVAMGPAGEAQATFLTNSAVLELAGGITTAESIFLGTDTAPITASLATGNLRNVSGNNVIAGQVGFDSLGTIGVDAGSQLTIAGDGVDNSGTATAALRKVGAGTLEVKNVRLPTLTASAGTLRISTGVAGVGTSRVSSLTVTPGALLDLNNNALVYDYTTTSPLQGIRVALLEGRIDTSVATAGAAIGYAEASTIFAAGTFPNSFAGQSVDNTTLLLIQTLIGDANLDRVVNFDDLVSLAQNYGASGVWRQGDFTYDGIVNFDDLVPLAQNYGQTVPGSVIEAAFGADFAGDWALAQSLAPEPAALVAAASALIGLAGRRRR